VLLHERYCRVRIDSISVESLDLMLRLVSSILT